MNTNKRFKRTPYSGYRRNYRRNKTSRRLYNGYRRPATTMVSNTTTIPDQMFVAVKYTLPLQSVTPAAVTSSFVCLGNGVNPVDSSFSDTKSPAGWDTFTTLYSNYRCMGSKMELVLENTSTAQSIQAILVPQNQNSTYTNFQDASCDPKASRIMTLQPSTSGNSTYRFVKYMSVAEIMGVSRERIRIDDQYQASMTNNPGSLFRWFCYIICSSSAMTYKVVYTVTFYMELYKKNNLALGA